ncbi:MAG: MMPL family transporter [Actinomycetota bacterium]|nr:MMPL family transporter [Actinomycetota bacterium]
MQKLARFAIHHRWYVVIAWLAVIVGTQALASAAGGATYKNVFTLPHTESQTVLNLLRSHGQSGATGQVGTIVVNARTGTLDSTRAPDGLVGTLTSTCSPDLHVATISAPWATVDCSHPSVPAAGNPQLLSANHATALITVAWQGNQNSVGNFTGVQDKITKLDGASTHYEFTGDAFANQKQSAAPELLGFIVALLILGIVFRTFGAAVLPLLSAAAALGTGLALISLLSHTMNVANFSTQLAQLMTIGVGVDYALFIVTRHRRNLMRGMSVSDSIVLAMNTSGRAVLFAGATVCIALLGLCALGVSFLYGVAVGTSIAVALTMVASLTLLPAVLSLFGLNVLPRKVRRAIRAGTYAAPTRPSRWASWANFVPRRKMTLGAVAGGLIVVLAIPFFSIRLGHADQETDPAGSTTRKGYDLITKDFGKGFNSVLELVISGPGASDKGYLASVQTKLAAVPNVNAATVHPVVLGSDLALVTFKSQTSPQDAKTTQLVKSLRSQVRPGLEQGTANKVYVFGQTAILVDFAKVLSAKIPLFFVAVIGLSVLLLMIAFRSLLIPATAAVMNLLAAGASFGIIVAIFQWGWGSQALGIGGGGPIDAFLPVLFFAILFGLSMDYQVFLVSRMHEEWVHTGDNKRAISVGQSETGGIITAAALIMIAVFGGFILGDSRAIKLVGVGLGGAIFLDAFILRTILVPAFMHIAGKANWYFPKWLDRITPHVSVDPDDRSWEADHPDGQRELAPV